MTSEPPASEIAFDPIPDDPIDRIQRELTQTGGANVRVKVSLVAPGRGKTYLGTLPPLNVDDVGDVPELVAQSYGGSGEGHFALEFRVDGKFAGNASITIAGEPFPPRRSPPHAAGQPNPMAATPGAPTTTPAIPSDTETKLKRALRRRRLENEDLRRELDGIKARLQTPSLPPTNPVDDAIKLMKTRPVDDPATQALQKQIEDLTKKLEASEVERRRERDDARTREERSHARELKRSLRFMKRKLKRLEAGDEKDGDDPLDELLSWKLKIEKAKAAGVASPFLDRLAKQLDEKFGDKILQFIEAKADSIIASQIPTPGGAATAKTDDTVGFAKFMQAQLLKGFQFVGDKAEVASAITKWPTLMTKLANLTKREELLAFCVEIGFPRAAAEAAFTEEKATACLQLIETLRQTLAAIAAETPPKDGAAAPKEGAK